MSELDGNWTTGCFPFDGQGNTQSALLTLSFDGSSSVYTEYAYSDTNCSVPAILPETGEVIEIEIVDSLEFPGESVSTALGEAHFINFTSGATTRYTIYTITDDGQLYFGDGISDSPETRPLTLDVFFFYIRM